MADLTDAEAIAFAARLAVALALLRSGGKLQ